jgi:two-component system OmpR family response regulator
VRQRILVLDQDWQMRAAMARLLAPIGCRVELADSAKRAREVLEEGSLALAIVAPDPLGAAGLALMQDLGTAGARLVVVAERPENICRTREAIPDAAAYWSKPLDEARAFRWLKDALGPPAQTAVYEEALLPALIERFGGNTLDTAAHSLIDARGQEVPLTPAEFALLVALARRRGQALSRDQLRKVVIGRGTEPYERGIDMLVSRLRRKIEGDCKAPKIIVTVPGVGYRFSAKAQDIIVPEGAALAASKTLSLIVLRFAGFSGDPEHRLFADSLADELPVDMSRMLEAHGTGPSRPFSQDRPVNLRQNGPDPTTHDAIDEHVRGSGHTISAVVRLSEIESGNCLWSGRFETGSIDPLKGLDDITMSIAVAVEFSFSKRK